MTKKDSYQQFEEFLNPNVVRGKFVAAGIYIVAYEMLERSIVGRIRDFFCFGNDEAGPGSPYDKEVLALDPKGKRGPLRASLVWLEQNNVITAADTNRFVEIKNARNELAHELSSLIGASRDIEIAAHLQAAIELLRKIETWWVINVELATDPDWAHQDVDAADVTPGTVMIMQIMLDVALGDDEEASKHLKAFQEQRAK